MFSALDPDNYDPNRRIEAAPLAACLVLMAAGWLVGGMLGSHSLGLVIGAVVCRILKAWREEVKARRAIDL